MSVILRSPEMATEKRVLGGSRNAAARASLDLPVAADEVGSAAMQSGVHVDVSDAGLRVDVHAHHGATGGVPAREQDAKAKYDSGYDAGYEAGMRTGETEGRAAYTAGLRQLEELTQNLNGSIQRSIDESEDMMVAIVYESVCKIVGDTLVTQQGVVAAVREAMGRVRGKSSVIVRVNPLDLELIEESAAFGVASETDWRSDESIPMGGCMIESEYGTLDARIDTQLNQLKRVLLAARHRPADADQTRRAD